MSDKTLDLLCINTMRLLAVDAVQKAGNGHPGTPMGAAPMAYVLMDVLYEQFGITPQHMVDEAIRLVRERQT